MGTTTRVQTRCRATASKATSVFPAPVGRTTTPRPPAAVHASSAASWYGRGAWDSRGVNGNAGAGSKSVPTR